MILLRTFELCEINERITELMFRIHQLYFAAAHIGLDHLWHLPLKESRVTGNMTREKRRSSR